MSQKDSIQKLKDRLLQRKEEVGRKILADRKDLTLDQENRGHGDAADQAFTAIYEELQGRLALTEAQEIVQIDEAIQRLNAGTYGLCSYCDGRILAARLQARPYSTTCIKCQTTLDSGRYLDKPKVQEPSKNGKSSHLDPEYDALIREVERGIYQEDED